MRQVERDGPGRGAVGPRHPACGAVEVGARRSRATGGADRIHDLLPAGTERAVGSGRLAAAAPRAADIGQVAGMQHAGVDHDLIARGELTRRRELAVRDPAREGPWRVRTATREDAPERLDVAGRHAAVGHGGEESTRQLDLAHAGHDRGQHLGDRGFVQALGFVQEGHLLRRLDRSRGEDGDVRGGASRARECRLERRAGREGKPLEAHGTGTAEEVNERLRHGA